jgi:hypothetical protein
MNTADLLTSANPSVTLGIGALLNGASDPDGDTLSVQLLSNVSHGQLTVLNDGSLLYEANAGFTGTDQLTYVVSDGQLHTGVGTVLITVPAAPPSDGPIIVGPGSGGGNTQPTPGRSDNASNATPGETEPAKDANTPPTPDKTPTTGSGGPVNEPPPAPADLIPNTTPAPRGTPAIVRQTISSSYAPANASARFTLTLNEQGLGLGLQAGNFLNAGNGAQPVAGLSLGAGLNLSLNTSSGHGVAREALLKFTESPDDHLMQVQKIAMQTSGAAVSVGAVWWATRVSGLLASPMISTPAWRSLDPLPVMGLDDKPAGEGEEDEDP